MRELHRVLADCGQADVCRVDAVVEPDDRNLAGNRIAIAHELEDQRNRDAVLLAGDRRGHAVHAQQLGDDLADARRPFGGRDDLRRDAGMRAALHERVEALLHAEVQRDVAVGAHIGDVAVPERDEVSRREDRPLHVVDVDRRRKAAFLRQYRIDADNRHGGGVELGDLGVVDVERHDDDRVGVAPHRQHLEELLALLDARDLEYRDVVAFFVQHLIEPLDHRGAEPQAYMVAHQQGHAQGAPRFERHGRARRGEIELLGDAQDLFSRGFGHQLGPREGTRYRGDGDVGRARHILNARAHTVPLRR